MTDNTHAGTLERPPWTRLVRLPGAGVRAMLAALAAAAPAEAIAFEAEELSRRFEQEWRRETAWRTRRGIRVAEIEAVAQQMRSDE